MTLPLRVHDVPYAAVGFSPCLWTDLSRYLEDDSAAAELAFGWRLAKAKVWIAMCATFGSEKHGNYRITFAAPKDELVVDLDLMFEVLHGTRGP